MRRGALVAVVAAAAAGFAAPSPPPAAAAIGTTVGIMPAGSGDAVRVRIAPGRSATRRVEVVNPTGSVQRIRLNALDAETTSDGVFTLAPDGVPRTGVGRWTRVTRRALVLRPGERRTVPVVVRVPAGAEPGDHSGGVVARIVSPRRAVTGDGGIGVAIVERVGVRVHVRVPGPRTAALGIGHIAVHAEEGGGLRGAIGLPDRVRVRFVAENTGNLRQEGIAGTVSLWRGGDRVAEARYRVGDLLPGERRLVQGRMDLPAVPQGDYRVRVDLDGLSRAEASAAFGIGWRSTMEIAFAALLAALIAGVWRWGLRRTA